MDEKKELAAAAAALDCKPGDFMSYKFYPGELVVIGPDGRKHFFGLDELLTAEPDRTDHGQANAKPGSTEHRTVKNTVRSSTTKRSRTTTKGKLQ